MNRKKLLIIVSSLLIIIITWILYPNCKDCDIEIVNDNLKYFHQTYGQCREKFISTCKRVKKQIPGISYSRIKVKSKIDNDLTIDLCYVPAQRKNKKLLILTSGLHGIEGFAGSAIQLNFMNKIPAREMLEKMGLLLVHGINPFGFKNYRRVTENNVDLNRNFDTDKSLFEIKNEGYRNFNEKLNLKRKVKTGLLQSLSFKLNLLSSLLAYSIQDLRQALLQGQYEYDKGVYFGGNDFEQQKELLEPEFKKMIGKYDEIFHVDLHTGYGKRHALHFLPGKIKLKKSLDAINKIFKGYAVEGDNSEDFYQVYGSFVTYVGKLVPKNKLFIPMVFEFGTLNNHKTLEGVDSLMRVALENQGHHYGYSSTKDEERVKLLTRELYYPDSKAWRSEVIRISEEVFPVLIGRYLEY